MKPQMRLIALRDIGGPLYKRKGDIFELPPGYARAYILAGFAQPAKREYRRRDVIAEDSREVTAEKS